MRTLALCATAWLLAAAAPAPNYDVVIRGGRILDGGGNPWVRADIAVKDGRIARIGLVEGRGRREIDASGRWVSPGFIDMMDQSGEVLLKNGRAENKLAMGVTTLISGEGGPPVEAAEIPGYFATLERQGITPNFATYYATLQARMAVMGDREGTPTAAQLELMKKQVDVAMKAGALGVSTALIYPPGSYQSTDELVALAKVAARCDGFYASHIRDESAGLVGAVAEAIEIGEKAGVKVEIFHLKAAYAPGWGSLMPKALAEIDAARARGVDVAADLYPYVAGGTGLSITVPNWLFAEGEDEGFRRLRDPQVRARLKRELAAGSQPGWTNLVEASGGWDRVILANPFNAKYDPHRGKSLAAIGKTLKRDPEDIAWDIVLEALPNRAMALFFMMDERDLELAMRKDWVSIGSDAAAAEKVGEVDALGLPHPRAYGTFPRIIAEYVQRRQMLTLENAVRKMTSWPATRMGLSDRGLLREGLAADIVVFDLATLDDRASFERPQAAPVGISHVLVNGVVVIDSGKHTGALPGRVLRGRCPA